MENSMLEIADSISINDAKHIITATISTQGEAFSDEDVADIQINQNGTKIKMPEGFTIGDDPPSFVFEGYEIYTKY